jgi:acyl-coenzyme A synthetase/AMP-(fatty) acid ligase
VTLPPAAPASQKQQLLDDIRAWADQQVAGYKKLRGGVFELNPLPKTPSGKILRRELPCKKKEAEGRAAKL